MRISVLLIVLGFLHSVYRTNSDFDFDFMFLGFTTSMQETGKVQDDWQAGGSKIEENGLELPIVWVNL